MPDAVVMGRATRAQARPPRVTTFPLPKQARTGQPEDKSLWRRALTTARLAQLLSPLRPSQLLLKQREPKTPRQPCWSSTGPILRDRFGWDEDCRLLGKPCRVHFRHGGDALELAQVLHAGAEVVVPQAVAVAPLARLDEVAGLEAHPVADILLPAPAPRLAPGAQIVCPVLVPLFDLVPRPAPPLEPRVEHGDLADRFLFACVWLDL